MYRLPTNKQISTCPCSTCFSLPQEALSLKEALSRLCKPSLFSHLMGHSTHMAILAYKYHGLMTICIPPIRWPFRTSLGSNPTPTNTPQPPFPGPIPPIFQALVLGLGDTWQIHAFGSAANGFSSTQSDLDVTCFLAGKTENFSHTESPWELVVCNPNMNALYNT